jgi:hypothetical protein
VLERAERGSFYRGTRNVAETSINEVPSFRVAFPSILEILMNLKRAAAGLAPLVALLLAAGAGGKWGH